MVVLNSVRWEGESLIGMEERSESNFYLSSSRKFSIDLLIWQMPEEYTFKHPLLIDHLVRSTTHDDAVKPSRSSLYEREGSVGARDLCHDLAHAARSPQVVQVHSRWSHGAARVLEQPASLRTAREHQHCRSIHVGAYIDDVISQPGPHSCVGVAPSPSTSTWNPDA